MPWLVIRDFNIEVEFEELKEFNDCLEEVDLEEHLGR